VTEKDVILIQQRVLLKHGNQQFSDSQQMECEVLTDSGQTVGDRSVHTDTEPTDSTV